MTCLMHTSDQLTSAEYIDRISKGDTPPKITEEYRGDFNEIKNNLNALIDVIQMERHSVTNKGRYGGKTDTGRSFKILGIMVT